MGRKGWRTGFNKFANWYSVEEYGQAEAVRLHMEDLKEMKAKEPGKFNEMLDELREYDYLSCWCAADEPCHVDNWIYFLSQALDNLKGT